MNKPDYSYFKLLAAQLAKLFHPALQVSLYDDSQQLVCTYNRIIANAITPIDSHDSVFLSSENRQFKAISIPLSEHYFLELLLDVSHLTQLQAFLDGFLNCHDNQAHSNSWHQQIDHLIDEYLQDNQLNINGLTSRSKRELVFRLEKQDAFKYQEASKYIAEKLSVSRATIYNYLKLAKELKAISVHQVDAFTDQPFSGNPAGVVLDADQLEVPVMKKISREMNLSETAFVLTSNKADVKMRYFTPSGHEVKFCGHSTVSALYMLAKEQHQNHPHPRQLSLSVETQSGIVETNITVNSEHDIQVCFIAPFKKLIAFKPQVEKICSELGINPDIINHKYPIAFETLNQDLYITLQSLKDLEQLQLSHQHAKAFAEKHNIIAYCFLINDKTANTPTIQTRCFAPAVGIIEDPFTGSILGGLSEYLIVNGILPKRASSYRMLQGQFMSRPGFVDVSLEQHGKKRNSRVHARAKHFFSTNIQL